MEWSNDRAIGRLRKFGFPRQPGTESVVKARNIIYEDLKGNVDNARIEEFRYRNVMKEVMMLWGTLLLVLILLKAIFWVSLYWLSMIFAIVGITLLILAIARFGYRQVFSRFHNKGPITGYNIIASIPAEIKEKKVIILGAHYDTKSVPDTKLLVSKFIMYVPLIVNLMVIILGILLVFFYYSILWWTSIIVWAGSLLEFITLGIYTLNVKIENESPGINDNGSGVAIVLELASIFSGNPLKNVTLEFALFDGEEIGLQGSSAYVSFHLQEFSKRNPWMVNFDELGGKLPLKVVTRAGLPIINHGIELVALFESAIKNNPKLNDLKSKENIKNNVFSIDAQSDHAPFFVSKIPSVYMYTSNKKRHSKNDNWENFNPDSIEACGILLEEFIRRADQDLN